jgi:tetratricopeptide (TPR) repeat protein
VHRAACSLKLGKARDAIEDCTSVLDGNSGNAKALYRRGQGYAAVHEYDSAMADLKAAALLQPDDKGVQGEHALSHM